MLARINRGFLPGSMDEIFNDDFLGHVSGKRSVTPLVNIVEDDSEFRIDLAAPGLSKDDFQIDVNEDVLTISSEREDKDEEKEGEFMRREFSYSAFKRCFQLPDAVNQDKIAAKQKDGILSIHLPRKEEEIKKGPKSIEIS